MKVFDFLQYSPEWWQTRRGKPTASEFSRIITPKTMELAAACEDYIDELIGDTFDLTYPPVDQTISWAMRKGIIAEPKTRQLFQIEHNIEVRQVGFILSDCGRFGCSPDGLVMVEDAGLEIKNPGAKTQIKRLRAGKVIPPDCLAQVHGGMAVSGLKKWWFFSNAIGCPPLSVLAEWNAYTDKLAVCLEIFWERYSKALAAIQAL